MNMNVVFCFRQPNLRKMRRIYNYSKSARVERDGAYGMRFSNGCLCGIKCCYPLKCYKACGEDGDADVGAAREQLFTLRSLIRLYGQPNSLNADEFAFFCSRARTMGLGPDPCRIRRREGTRQNSGLLEC